MGYIHDGRVILSLQNTVVMAFLQYKTVAIPGKSLKRKVTLEETRERKKQYEKDRERKFIDSRKQVVLLDQRKG
jgi:hypothetical protein